MTIRRLLACAVAAALMASGAEAQWQTLAPMPTARRFFAAASIGDKIFAVGGDGTLNTLEVYNSTTNEWTTGASIPTPKSGLAVAAIDGNLYAVSANVESDLEVYDPVAASWTTRTPVPHAQVVHAAAAIGGKLYVLGWTLDNYVNTLDIYDTMADRWSIGTPIPSVRSYVAAATIGGKLYVVGGANTTGGILKTLEIYDPEADSWSTGASMLTARMGLGAAAINGRLYAVGGKGNDGSDYYTDVVEIYDPTTNTWSTGAPTSIARMGLAAATTGGRLYAIGGLGESGTLSTLEIFDPQGISGPITTRTWTNANSPYRVTGTITVTAGNTLTIEPGVDVLFDADVQFIVQGRLQAVGTETDSIRFLKGTASEWGGIRISGGDSSTLSYMRISHSSAGGILVDDGTTRCEISHTAFRGNRGSYHGGAWIRNSRARFSSCSFVGNASTAGAGGGGGVLISSGEVVFEKCLFARNSSIRGGAGVYNDGGVGVNFINCTLVNNVVSENGGLESGISTQGTTTVLKNCIVWNNLPDDFKTNGGVIGYTFCDVTNASVEGLGNISAYPRFIDPSKDDFRISGDSPCIDIGDPTSPRDPDGTRADMGAFPYTHPPIVVSVPADTTFEAGAIVRLPVRTTGLTVAHNVNAMQVKVLYPTNLLTYRKCDRGPIIPSSGMLATNATTPGTLIVAWAGDAVPIAGDGVLLSIEFAVNAAAADGVSGPVTFSEHDGKPLFESDGGNPAVLIQNGVVSVHNPGLPENHVPVWSARSDVSGPENAPISFIVSATDLDGQTLTYSAPTLPAGATFDPATRAFSWTPTYDQSGSHQAIFSVTDGEITVRDTVGITVTNVNRSPVWTQHADRNASEGMPITVDLESATDADGQPLTYLATLLPGGAAFDTSSRRFSWTPGYAQAGIHEAIFTVSDGASSVADTIRITVANTNRPPTWTTLRDTTVAEGDRLVLVLVAAVDPDGETLTYAATDLPSGATFIPAMRTFDWTPAYNQAGSHPVAFSVTDGVIVVRDTVRITVTNVNRAPVWSTRFDVTGPESSPISFTVLATDADGQPLTYSAPSLPIGAAFDPSTRAFSWTPTYDLAGDHVAIFSVTDGEAVVRDTVGITVTNVNRSPVWARHADRNASEGMPFSIALDPATDADGQPLTYLASFLPGGAAFDTSSRRFSWTPGYAQAGVHEAIFAVTDGASSVADTIRITVANTNRPPTWTTHRDTTVAEGDRIALVLAAAVDPDGETLTYAAADLPSGATFVPATRTFDWTPAYDQAGSHPVAFSVTDGAIVVRDTVVITVTNVNRPPVWSTRPDLTGPEGLLIAFTVSATDPDGQTLIYSAPTLPMGATFDPSTRAFSWTPTYDQSGNHQAIFSVTDGEITVRDTVGITVTNVNRPPIWAQHPDQATAEGTALAFTLDAATDPDGQTLTYAALALPSGATFGAGTRQFDWTPGYDAAGDHEAVFSATDGAVFLRDTVAITVANVDRPPSFTGAATNFSQTIDEGWRPVAVVAVDPDGDPIVYSVRGGSLPGGIALAADGTFSGIADIASAGQFSVTIRATSGGLYAETFLSITVRDVNWTPVWTPRPDTSVAENALLVFTVAATDPDGGSLAYSAPSLPAGASFNPAARMFSWTPTYDAAGVHSAIFSVTDGPATARDTVAIAVANMNRPPSGAIVTGGKVSSGRTVAFAYAGSDPDGEATTLRAASLPERATFDPASGAFIWTRGAGQGADAVVVLGISDAQVEVLDTLAIVAATANAIPTIAWASSLPDTVSWDVALPLNVSDPDGDAVDLTAVCSANGVQQPLPSFTGMSGPTPRTATALWPTATLLPGRSIVSDAVVRIVARDMDGAPPLWHAFTVLNLPCDWDRDGRIGLADFATLRAAWQAQDTTRNLGPYAVRGGTSFPDIVRTQDRKIDFDDLMTFTMLWDWARPRGRIKPVARLAARVAEGSEGGPVLVEVVAEPSPRIVVRLADPMAADVAGIALTLPPEIFSRARIERGGWVGTDGWWLSRADSSAGMVEIWTARLAPVPADGIIATIALPSGMADASVGVAWELHRRTAQPLSGALAREVRLVPTQWSLSVAPNPFNPATTIRFDVPSAERVRIVVYDVLGREVAVLVDETREPGRHKVAWDGRDTTGRLVASGTYIVRLSAGQVRISRRVTLMR